MKKIIITALSAATLGSGLYAGGCNGVVCDQVKIEEIVATAWGSITISTDANEGSLSCGTYAGKYVYIAATSPGKNAMYSALLTAKTTNTPIRINMQADSSGICQITYINVK